MRVWDRIYQQEQMADIEITVYYNGTTALAKGQGLCYDADYGTATTKERSRMSRVELPSKTNNKYFAGWTKEGYTATQVASGFTPVVIVVPRSTAEISIIDDSVCSAAGVLGTLFTCIADMGTGGSGLNLSNGALTLRGAGTAEALFTNASGSKFKSIDGSASLVNSTKTLTKTGIGTASAVGDYVYIAAGAASGMAAAVTQGRYTVASIASADAVVLDSAPGSGTTLVACYVTAGNQLAMCETDPYGGPQSGLTNWYMPVQASTITDQMIEGFTNIFGGTTMTADATETLANGKYIGQRKVWVLRGALTTGDYLVAPATAGVKHDGTTAWGTNAELDGASDALGVVWDGVQFRTTLLSGTVYV